MNRKTMLAFGIFFLVMEAAKQFYLYFGVFGEYNVWYFPFQLCSMPIYLCILYGLTGRGGTPFLTLLMDYGMLGGALSLIYHEGFTFAGHPLLTAHGYIWHTAMVILSILIFSSSIKQSHSAAPEVLSFKSYCRASALFLALAACAFVIDIALHPFGDCDMFYISPFHNSSQPVFGDVDAAIGKPAGIIIYLAAVIVGAGIVHTVYYSISRRNR